MVEIVGGKYIIEHLGKSLTTSHYHELSDLECAEIKMAYYKKPDKRKVINNLRKICNGGTNVSDITKFYVKDLMAKVKLYSPRWSIEDVLNCNDLICYFYSRILSSETVYPQSNTTIDNFETALRLSGGGVAMKPSNFPMKSVDSVLRKYNINNNYYDFSCGWGVRMLSALKNNVNYYGTDPNHELVDRLNQMSSDYRMVNKKLFAQSITEIKCVGSEVFQPAWENKIGLAFSSPPYFNLEDYKIGNQSYKDGTTYSQWLDSYMTDTIGNIHNYLIQGGYFLINVKDFNGMALCSDIKLIAEGVGFKYVESLELKNSARPSSKKDLNTDEQIMVFKKP